GSLKQATYVREKNPNSRAYIFYIDLRTPGTYEFFSKKVQTDENVSVMKGKVAKIIEDPTSKQLIVEAEDILSAQIFRVKVDLVVLATGMVPSMEEKKPAAEVGYDKDHFVLPDESAPGIYAAGCARGPVDVATSAQDATAAALKAIQAIHSAVQR
ncbi:MAG: heterodisulfide reductase subunit A, partial [Candidatus Binatia bacterium]